MRSISKILTAFGFLLMVGCGQQRETLDLPAVELPKEVIEAVAVMHPTEGNDVRGEVHFIQLGDAVQMVVNLSGLTPGKHGFHIHEFGDCSAPDATTAGGHYNPEDNPHAGHSAGQRHVGDLGNIEANADGFASMRFVDSHLSLNGPNAIIGRGIIVHAGEDDLQTQPSGAAGARVACGVVGIAKPDVESGNM